jgi:hypothetical protein
VSTKWHTQNMLKKSCGMHHYIIADNCWYHYPRWMTNISMRSCVHEVVLLNRDRQTDELTTQKYNALSMTVPDIETLRRSKIKIRKKWEIYSLHSKQTCSHYAYGWQSPPSQPQCIYLTLLPLKSIFRFIPNAIRHREDINKLMMDTQFLSYTVRIQRS